MNQYNSGDTNRTTFRLFVANTGTDGLIVGGLVNETWRNLNYQYLPSA